MGFLLFAIGALVLYLFVKSLGSSSNRNVQNSGSIRSKYQVTTNKKASTRIVADYDEDDDLATFSISYGLREEQSKNQTPGRWVKLGERCLVRGQEIAHGGFYVGGRLSSVDGYGTESSLVDDSLPTEDRPISYQDASLGYWPTYISLSPGCRGAYINWLTSRRDDPTTPLGYVFVYFYGMERRVAVDSLTATVEDSEFRGIFEEVLRLRNAYDKSGSFRGYSTRLLELMYLLRPSVVSDPELEMNPLRDSILLRYWLARTVNDGKPISDDLALAWLRFYPEYNLKKPARRCSSEFNEMFKRRYARKYGDGIVVKPNKTRLKIGYWPASSSLRGLEVPQEDLPDPSNLKGPTRKLIAIADECVEALGAYSRYLGTQGTSREDIYAAVLLPEELTDISAADKLNGFKKWAEERISKNGGLVEVSEFWRFTDTPLPEKFSKKESDLIQMLAEKVGFGVAPDTRYHHAKPTPDGKLVMFRDGHGKHFEPSRAYRVMGMTLRLGAMVATTDRSLDRSEVTLLERLIEHDVNLSPVEKRSLGAYLVWRLTTSSNVTGLRGRLSDLGADEKAALSRILVGVAMADGTIDPEEVKQLEKLYTLLGLEKALVTSDIHRLTTGASGNRQTNSPPASSRSGIGHSGGFEIDESLLAIHEAQTKDVQTLLDAIFVDEESAAETDELTAVDREEFEMAMDAQHRSLYQSLISKDRWSRVELDSLCEKLGLMASGAIETINDWSFERVEAPLIDENFDALYVDPEVVEELEG